MQKKLFKVKKLVDLFNSYLFLDNINNYAKFSEPILDIIGYQLKTSLNNQSKIYEGLKTTQNSIIDVALLRHINYDSHQIATDTKTSLLYGNKSNIKITNNFDWKRHLLGKDTELLGPLLEIKREVYASTESEEFNLNMLLEKNLIERALSKEEVVKNPIWQALFNYDRSLLESYSKVVFETLAKSCLQNNYKKNAMGIFIGPEVNYSARSFVIDSLLDGSYAIANTPLYNQGSFISINLLKQKKRTNKEIKSLLLDLFWPEIDAFFKKRLANSLITKISINKTKKEFLSKLEKIVEN